MRSNGPKNLMDEQEVRERIPWRLAGKSFPPVQQREIYREHKHSVVHMAAFTGLLQRLCQAFLLDLQVDYANEHKRQFSFQWWYWSYEITIILWSFVLCLLNIGNFLDLGFLMRKNCNKRNDY